MLTRLYTAYQGPFDQQPDPQNPGVYTALYLRTNSSWESDAKLVVVGDATDESYVGGYQGAQPAPESGGIPTTQVVDSYPFEGKTRRVFHDGMGGVTFQDSVAAFLTKATPTAVTAAGGDGQVDLTISGGTAPFSVQLIPYTPSPGATKPSATGQPVNFGQLVAGPYLVSTTDSGNPAQVSLASTEVPPYVAPKNGCTDPEADNYDPAATTDNGSCTYSPRWRAAWGEMAVAVLPLAGTTAGYLDASLRIGFPDGHPLAGIRPLGEPLTVRAVVRPTGEAVFNLGPYVRPALGAPDGSGGYRLDLNSPTAATSDLYVGYELRRPTGELLQRGYALNAAVPDGQLPDLLTPFPKAAPIWPGFENYQLSYRTTIGRYGELISLQAASSDTILLPCPLNPVPVAWLARGGGFGYWVFQGRPQLGDDVGDSQAYAEAGTNERRYSQRGEQRRTVQATSGPFRGADLADGLRTLWGSPQVWYQPVVGGPWVPVTLEDGSFPLRRLGVGRIEVPISFTEAVAQAVQGQ